MPTNPAPLRSVPEPTPVGKLFTVEQVAERWQVAERTVREKIAQGDLPAIRFGRLVRIHVDDVAAYVAAHRTVGRPDVERRAS